MLACEEPKSIGKRELPIPSNFELAPPDTRLPRLSKMDGSASCFLKMFESSEAPDGVDAFFMSPPSKTGIAASIAEFVLLFSNPTADPI